MNRLQANWENAAVMKFHPQDLAFSCGLISANKKKDVSNEVFYI